MAWIGSKRPGPEPPPARILLLPGWQDSGPAHWQSRWEALHGFQRVQQADWEWPRRGDWMARLEDVLIAADRPAVLVAHSLGCLLIAAWAAVSPWSSGNWCPPNQTSSTLSTGSHPLPGDARAHPQ